jgi:hypothetical protein
MRSVKSLIERYLGMTKAITNQLNQLAITAFTIDNEDCRDGDCKATLMTVLSPVRTASLRELGQGLRPDAV